MPVDMQMHSRCLLVLGMHRSGTSAMTRCLNLVGMDVGPNLLTPDEGNAKGYWEHADVVRINDALLSAFGMLWWSLDPLPDGWLKSEAAAKARVEIETFVRRDFSGVPLWGLKDPRMCRLAPLWIEALCRMGFVVEAVFVSRPPLEVAKSMVRGHELPEQACVLGWMQHLAEAVHATHGMRRAMLSYEQLLGDPIAVLDRVAQDLAMEWPIAPSQRRDALNAFVDKDMRTQRDLPGESSLPLLARNMDACCREIAAPGARQNDWSALTRLCDQVEEGMRLLDYRRGIELPDEVHKRLADSKPRFERMFAALYHAAEGEDFSEDRVVIQDLAMGRTQVEFELQSDGGTRYRLDPISHAGYCVVHSLVALDVHRRVIWDWSKAPEQLHIRGVEQVASSGSPGGPLHRTSDDPQIHFSWTGGSNVGAKRLQLDIERFDVDRLTREFDALQLLRSECARQVEILTVKLDDERSSSLSLTEHLSETRQSLTELMATVEPMRRAQERQQAALQVLLGRSLGARFRRRFLSTAFSLAPVRHLESVDAADGRWQVTGDDPIFACHSGRLPLGAGWYMISLDLRQHAGLPVRARLYPDYGPDGPHDGHGSPLKFIEPGNSRHRGIVRFTNTLYGLRFDPADAPCDISVGQLVLRRVSKLRAAWMMLRAIATLQRAPGQRSGWRPLLGAARRAGVRGLARWLYTAYVAPGSQDDAYDRWLQNYDAVTPKDCECAREESAAWASQPVISILVPAYNSPAKWLRRCIDTVREQAYPHWQLCIANDASTMPHVARILDEYAAADSRIRVVHRPVNGHISATSNSALALATGEFVALLDHDDELHPLALFEVAKSLQAHPSYKLIYTDEDKIDEEGRRYDPYMKPDWNYDLLLSQNCISHFGIYQRQLVLEVGGFREGYEGSQDWDLALRCIERLQPWEIGHVSRVLYHWRAIPGSTAVGVDEKSYARTAGIRSVTEHLQRMGVDASVQESAGRQGHLQIRYALATPQPKISLIIPTRDGLHLLKRCVDSILALTTYENYEIVIVDNQSSEASTLDYFAKVVAEARVRVLAYDQPFNYSALNNYAVQQTSGELVALVNNDVEVISPDWLQEMAGHAMRRDIGAVGAMLYYPNDTIQHAGVVLGVHGVAAHAYCGQPRGYPGQMGRARLTQNFSAVTAACLLVRRAVFEQAGGLNESLRVAFNDVDFCLRIRKLGYRNLWTPFAELYHHESATRGHEDSPEKQARFAGEVERICAIWGDELTTDPAYSPNLTLTGTPFELAFPPRTIG